MENTDTLELFKKLLNKYPFENGGWEIDWDQSSNILSINNRLLDIVVALSPDDFKTTRVNGIKVDCAMSIGLLFSYIIRDFFTKKYNAEKSERDRDIKWLNRKLVSMIED